MQCPRDGTALGKRAFHAKVLQDCSSCCGVFVPGNTVDELHAMARASSHAHAKAPVLRGHRHIVCPHDAQPMRPIVYRGVEIDVCPSCHGIWLDAHEVRKILEERGASDRLGNLDRRLESAETNFETSSDPGAAADGVFDFLGDAVSAIGDVLGSLGDLSF